MFISLPKSTVDERLGWMVLKNEKKILADVMELGGELAGARLRSLVASFQTISAIFVVEIVQRLDALASLSD